MKSTTCSVVAESQQAAHERANNAALREKEQQERGEAVKAEKAANNIKIINNFILINDPTIIPDEITNFLNLKNIKYNDIFTYKNSNIGDGIGISFVDDTEAKKNGEILFRDFLLTRL